MDQPETNEHLTAIRLHSNLRMDMDRRLRARENVSREEIDSLFEADKAYLRELDTFISKDRSRDLSSDQREYMNEILKAFFKERLDLYAYKQDDLDSILSRIDTSTPDQRTVTLGEEALSILECACLFTRYDSEKVVEAGTLEMVRMTACLQPKNCPTDSERAELSTIKHIFSIMDETLGYHIIYYVLKRLRDARTLKLLEKVLGLEGVQKPELADMYNTLRGRSKVIEDASSAILMGHNHSRLSQVL